MAHVTFKGGVYPHKRKRFTREKTLEEYLPKGDLVYPLLQHIGGMAVPVVEPGERVLEGQLIARASGDISAPVHASVSGIVRSIEPRLTVSGKMILSIVVENDGAYEKYPAEEIGPWKELEPGERLRRIRDAGVVGMGGAGFPTHVKLAVRNPKRIRYVIVNGTECEPYMTGDYRRMVEEPEHLVEGLEIVLGFFERAVGILALEDNKRDAITALQMAVREEPRMEVRVFETKYPQGAERMLIYSVSGMEIDSTQLPADAGCIVLNVETVCAIRQALVEGRPLIQRAVTVTGKALKNPRNLLVRLGTSFAELPEAAGGFAREPRKFVCGGPMRGTALPDLDVPVVKTSAGLLCMSKDYLFKPSACIRCGSCAEVCPIHLLPARLAELASQDKEEEFRHMHGMECLGCGSCSYVCPARRALAPAIQGMRKSLLAQGKR